MEVEPLSVFEREAKARIRETMKKLGHDIILPMEIPSTELGDFAFPCFNAAKEMKKAPVEIATLIVENMDKSQMFEKVMNNGPYVNFFVAQEKLIGITLDSILNLREEYGSFPHTGRKILVEHTSANPNGPLHIGRARNPIIGDTLARILKRCGHDVITEFYVDDMGKQQVTMTWGVDNLNFEMNDDSKPDHIMVKFYQEATSRSESNPDVLAEIDRMLSLYEKGDKNIALRVHQNCEKALQGILKSLIRLDIYFDNFAWESKYVMDGSVGQVIERLKKLDCTFEDNGALYMDLEEFGIHGREQRFFLTRGDGSSLYSTRDIAYHLDKLDRCEEAINVLGEDHKLKAKTVSICLKLLGSEKVPDVVFYSFVSLPEGKMSTRKGRVVYLDDLIEEGVSRAYEEVSERRPDLPEEIKRGIAETVGIGSIRYNIIRVQAEKQITFKWEEALSFEGNSAPFIQYSHARASSILQKATGYHDPAPQLLLHETEISLIKSLARLPSITKKCAESRIAHPIANYAYEVASLFNQFYRDCPVLTAEEDIRNARLALVEAAKWVMRNTLETLGITAPEEM